MNPTWQPGKLREFCRANKIAVAAYSPPGAVGAFWGTKGVLESEVLLEIAKSKGKSGEPGVVIVFRSFNKERLKQYLQIFDWELSDEESKKIAEIPQSRANLCQMFIFETGPVKSLEELWDGEV